MLKSSSLCLYSSNLGTFWLKIEQFWSFEEISIFRDQLSRVFDLVNDVDLLDSRDPTNLQLLGRPDDHSFFFIGGRNGSRSMQEKRKG
jgi:hypothetical protein